MDPFALGRRFGRYTARRLIGVGAMGYVYEAFDPLLSRRVALKLVRKEVEGHGAEVDHELRLGLLREARALARLSHPNVVTVHDVGETDDGLFFLAMKLVDGETLARWLPRKHRSWHEILDVYLEAGRGLAAAHQAGVVHRDFQPSSVLVAIEGDRVFVTDFGARLGTPAYMAPEQLAGQPADVRSDVYSFCVSLWEGLYGVRPGSGRAAKDDDVPARIREALEKGLRASPDERPQRLDNLLAELQRQRLQVLFEGALDGQLHPQAGASPGFPRCATSIGYVLAIVEHFAESGEAAPTASSAPLGLRGRSRL